MNKQWYDEIQEILYSKFAFTLHVQLRDGRLRDISCSILPQQAFSLIRRMKFTFNVPWKYIERGFDESLIKETRALLGRFRSVAIHFKHPNEETVESSGTDSNGRCHYISPKVEPKVLETMLTLGRLFRHMDDLIFFVDGTLEELEDYARYHALKRKREEWEDEGLECENLAVSCANILHEELKSDKAATGRKFPRMYVGPEENCPIWKVNSIGITLILGMTVNCGSLILGCHV